MLMLLNSSPTFSSLQIIIDGAPLREILNGKHEMMVPHDGTMMVLFGLGPSYLISNNKLPTIY